MHNLYILAFDHRNTFAEHLFAVSLDKFTPEQIAAVTDFKKIIYDGFLDAVAKGIPKDSAAILVDEEYGSAILLDAKAKGFTTILTVEKSGTKELDFEYGRAFGQHIEKYQPTYAKILIKYNPDDDAEIKKHQQEKLQEVSEFVHDNHLKFLLEVLVAPTKEQLDRVSGDRDAYDKAIRPDLTVAVIKELQDAGINVDVWKLEGMDEKSSYEKVMAQIKEGAFPSEGLVILGRGAGEEKVEEWISVGSSVDGVIGFAVGRTIFWDAIEAFYKKTMNREEAVAQISHNFYHFYEIFKEGRK